MSKATYSVDEALKARIRARVGAASDAVVEIHEEHWDDGFCETCSYPEEGFSVSVDGVYVWPTAEHADEYGGRWVGYDPEHLADRDGYVAGNVLSVFGQFDAWLNGRPWGADDD